jgi:hypothetical protein
MNFSKKKMKRKGLRKNIIEKSRNTFVITIIILVFILGVIFGRSTANETLSELEYELRNIELEVNSITERLMFFELFGKDVCDQTMIDTLELKLEEIRVRLVELEKDEKINTKEYSLLKQTYNINQVLFYTTHKKYKQNCEIESEIILFFFDDSVSSLRQGQELDKVHRERKVKILPMNYGYTPSLDYFYEFHQIERLPALIINYDKKLEGFNSKENILSAINN